MSKPSQDIKQSNDPTAEIQAAIEKLEKFVEQNQTKEVLHVQHLDVQNGGVNASSTTSNLFKKTMNFIASAFSDKVREMQIKKHACVQNEIIGAIKVVTSNYLFIVDKLKNGNQAQKKLAASALAAINRYNEAIVQARKQPPKWSKRIVKFLYDRIGISIDDQPTRTVIELPSPILIHNEFSKKIEPSKKITQKFDSPSTAASTQKISFFIKKQNEIGVKISKQEEDAFRMKAIALLHSYGNPFPSLSDEQRAIRVTPIQAIAENSETVTLFQKYTTYPGETFEVQGSFKRARQSSCSSIPIPESFHLSSKSVQTGFPHPSQRAGWALADQLIPIMPQKLDRLLILQPIYQRKHEIAKALLPNGNLIAKAKELLKLKRLSFEEHKKENLEAHYRLNKAIVQAAITSNQTVPLIVDHTIDRYFALLEQKPNAFDYLCETQQTLIESFIGQPYEKLKNDWLEHSHPELTHADSHMRCQAALNSLEKEFQKVLEQVQEQHKQLTTEEELSTLDYILCMGQILSKPCQVIILQHFSEIIGFTAPTLKDFEKKIQLAVYKQLKEFLEEFDLIDINQTEDQNRNQLDLHLKKQVESDIAIFQAQSFEDIEHPAVEIIHELEQYYQDFVTSCVTSSS